jgi:hypothetical protein
MPQSWRSRRTRQWLAYRGAERVRHAIHEAAHVVVRAAMGLPPPVCVSIRPRGDKGGYVEAPSALDADSPERAAVRGEVVMVLAGEAATLLIDRSSGALSRAEAENDYVDARRAIAWLHSPGERRAALARLRRRAADAVARAWPAIVAVAEALIRRGRLSGRAAARIVDRVLGARGRPGRPARTAGAHAAARRPRRGRHTPRQAHARSQPGRTTRPLRRP